MRGVSVVSQKIPRFLLWTQKSDIWTRIDMPRHCTYPLQRALLRWLETGRPRTLCRSSCWPRSWSRTRTPLRARRSRTLASWKTSSSFQLSLSPVTIPVKWQLLPQAAQISFVVSPYLLIWDRFSSCMFRIWFFRRRYLLSADTTFSTVHK